MGRYLIVANQTLGGATLEQKVRDRIATGEGRFYVVVPMIEPEREASGWAPHDPAFGVPAQVNAGGEAAQLARDRSQHRLRAMVDRITELGGHAEGEVGDPDPVKAVRNVLDREEFHEIIISTLPAGISRWVKMDLPSRVDRMAGCPVTIVEAEG